MNWRTLVSLAVCLVLCGRLSAQDQSDRTFGQIYKYLTRDLKSRYFANPLLFVGEITALGPVFHGVCKSAVNETVDFAVSELLLGDLAEDTFQAGYPNCTWQPLPSPPFTLHSQVIVFCHHHLCDQPVPATPERLAKVREWMAEAKQPEDHAAFEQLRQAIKKANPLRETSDLIFEGEIARIEPVGKSACTVAVGREVEINIVQTLFGGTTKGSILASYGSVNCPIPLPLSVRRHAKVIVYCALQLPISQSCLVPVESSQEKLATVKSWIEAQSRSVVKP